MDERQINKFIGQGIVVIIVYFILQAIVPFLIWAVILMIGFRYFQEWKK